MEDLGSKVQVPDFDICCETGTLAPCSALVYQFLHAVGEDERGARLTQARWHQGQEANGFHARCVSARCGHVAGAGLAGEVPQSISIHVGISAQRAG